VDEPTSIQDFERLLVSNPNSSMLWIQYMSFFLLAADIDAARAVGLRAIRTISFREEDVRHPLPLPLVS
jgi:rRNA biogenesis protein RRP5